MTAQAAGKIPVIGGAKTLRQLEYHPKTFAQRGAVVPFTTRQLVQGRVRMGRKQDRNPAIEILLSGFAGSTSVYVTPLTTIGDMVRLSVHDRAFIERIIEREAVTPVTIRECWSEIGRWSLGGAEEARRVRDWDEARDETFRADRIILLQDLARTKKLKLPEPLVRDLMKQRGEGVFHAAIEAMSVAGDMDSEVIARRIAAVAALMSGIGHRTSPAHGPLRSQIARLSELAQMLAVWGEETMSDVGPTAVVCAGGAAMTQELAEVSLRRIDRLTVKTTSLLDENSGSARQLAKEVERLHWLLDGWEYILEQWDLVIARKALAEDIVQEISRLLPIVPPEETRSASDEPAPVRARGQEAGIR